MAPSKLVEARVAQGRGCMRGADLGAATRPRPARGAFSHTTHPPSLDGGCMALLLGLWTCWRWLCVSGMSAGGTTSMEDGRKSPQPVKALRPNLSPAPPNSSSCIASPPSPSVPGLEPVLATQHALCSLYPAAVRGAGRHMAVHAAGRRHASALSTQRPGNQQHWRVTERARQRRQVPKRNPKTSQAQDGPRTPRREQRAVCGHHRVPALGRACSVAITTNALLLSARKTQKSEIIQMMDVTPSHQPKQVPPHWV